MTLFGISVDIFVVNVVLELAKRTSEVALRLFVCRPAIPPCLLLRALLAHTVLSSDLVGSMHRIKRDAIGVLFSAGPVAHMAAAGGIYSARNVVDII